MLLAIKTRILQAIERAGYVVIKVADYRRREALIADYEVELTQRADRIADFEKLRGYHEAELTRRAERIAQLEELCGHLAPEPTQRTQRLYAELTRPAANVGRFEKLVGDPGLGLTWQHPSSFATADDLASRLAREHDARELEAARAETWDLRTLAAELQWQLEEARRERSDRNDPGSHGAAGASPAT